MARRRGQAAMEFLMTYGWSVLVVLIVIGALAYFGVLNPQRLLPPKCVFMVGLYCLDYRVAISDPVLQFQIENGMGRDVEILNIYVNESSATQQLRCTIPGANISNGQQIAFSINSGSCDQAPTTSMTGSKYKFDIKFDYMFADSSFQHTGHGELFAAVEN